MKTKIYKNYFEFIEREEDEENGVSEEFAKNHPNFEEMNTTNKGCWDCYACRDCRGCYDCYDCYACNDCYACSDCRHSSSCNACNACNGLSNCSNCSDCYDSSYCRECRDCRGCNDCNGLSNCRNCSNCSYCGNCNGLSNCGNCNGLSNLSVKAKEIKIPKIKNIHQKVYEAVSIEGALDMSDWHKCETTHCRAGWVVTLAGENGKKLEKILSTPIAAAKIYAENSQIRVNWPNQFFTDNKTAFEDIKRCALEEKSLKKVKK